MEKSSREVVQEQDDLHQCWRYTISCLVDDGEGEAEREEKGYRKGLRK